jgi:hypothetical protein
MKFGSLSILCLCLATPAFGLPVYRESEIFDPSSREATGIDFTMLQLDLAGTDALRLPGYEPGLEMDLSGVSTAAQFRLTLEFDVPITGVESDDDLDSSYHYFWSPEGPIEIFVGKPEYVGSLRSAFDERPSAVAIDALLVEDEAIPAIRVTKTFGIRWRLHTPGGSALVPVIAPIPEPSTGLLVGVGLAGLTFRRHRSPGASA